MIDIPPTNLNNHVSFQCHIGHVVRRMVVQEWGGTESVVLKTCQYLQRRGYCPSILSTSAFSQPGVDEIEEISIQRFRYSYPFWPLTKKKIMDFDKKGGNPLSFGLFSHLFRRKGLGLVHLHAMGRLGAQVRTACRLRNIPYVVSLHGGHICVPAQEEQYLSKLSRGLFDWGKPFGALFGTRKVLSDAAAIICVGYAEYCAVRDRYPQKIVRYIPHGVNIQDLSSGNGQRFRKAHGMGGSPMLLCVGRIDPQKNQLALVQALPRIHLDCADVKLVLIGPVTVSAYLERIRSEIVSLKMEKHILIIPGLPPNSAELRDAYAACDIFVLPSIHEPFGVVLLEAWACSKPVVISPLGNLQHTVQHNVNGLHLRNTTPEEIGGVLRQLLLDKERSKQLGTAGQLTAVQEYSWDLTIDRLLELYAEVLKRPITSC